MIRSLIFSEGKLVGRDLEVEALRLVRADKGLVIWVDLEDPTDDETKAILEGVFQFHPLAIEDCVAPSSLPKIEDYDDYFFLVAHCVDPTRIEKFNTTEINLFLGRDFMVTFHRARMHVVQSVLERCARFIGGVIARGPDRLAHLLLDALIDNFKPVTDELRNELDLIEENVLSEETDGRRATTLIPKLIEVRSEINHLRQIIRPLREVVGRLTMGGSKNIRAATLPYFRDLRDNLIRIDETAATYADQLLISFDLYLNKSDFQANEGIKTLTALTALTLPATLVGTWYGMNFENMPELKTPFGYPIAIGVTLVITAVIWFWCKRRRWI
ncbi:magnesium/cobalt transporter CorA [Ereboglobus luteus]|uniref:Magnesium transport protein CorA n=1 Tax=Ereboglobus luteus TaxID=1796921 RepID=A0A2U8E5V8_9BACT|nr:magnesium/cobalt transporter CorA [Ereboglobus luteus]AWI09944.1 magnesium and cobalt transport protein CorA [Ereboglobus luteus]